MRISGRALGLLMIQPCHLTLPVATQAVGVNALISRNGLQCRTTTL